MAISSCYVQRGISILIFTVYFGSYKVRIKFTYAHVFSAMRLKGIHTLLHTLSSILSYQIKYKQLKAELGVASHEKELGQKEIQMSFTVLGTRTPRLQLVHTFLGVTSTEYRLISE